jgi:hypothetical protein
MGISNSTRRALAAAPEYWLHWYTIKSLALVGAAAWIGYLYGSRKD